MLLSGYDEVMSVVFFHTSALSIGCLGVSVDMVQKLMILSRLE